MKRCFYARLLPLALALALLCGCTVTPLEKPEVPDPVPLPVPAVSTEPEEDADRPADEPEETQPAGDQPEDTQPEDTQPEDTQPEDTPPAEEDPQEPDTPQEEDPFTEYPAFPEGISLASGQAFVYDLDQGGIVAMKGAGEKLYPASVTKLLTILTAEQYVTMDQLITPGDEQSLVASDSSIAYVNSSHTLTAEQLIEGMLLPSGNDAANALAAAAGRNLANDQSLSGVDAVQVLVGAMNEYAAELGMTSSHFVTVDGYLDEDHYSTVEDMARLSVAAAQDEIIRRYCGLAADDVTYYSGDTIRWTNSNQMLNPESVWYSPYVTGMKTGSLSYNLSLVCTLEKDGRHYVAGVFTAADNQARYSDMTTIVNWLFGGE